MRKTWMIGLCAALGLGGAACQQARSDQSQQPPNDQARSQQRQQTTTGRVASVGTTEMVLTQPGHPELHVRIDSNVPVTVDGEKATVNDIPSGADVNVVIKQQGDQQVAQRIDAMTRVPVRGTEEQPR
jgi:hypothetical protein